MALGSPHYCFISKMVEHQTKNLYATTASQPFVNTFPSNFAICHLLVWIPPFPQEIVTTINYLNQSKFCNIARKQKYLPTMTWYIYEFAPKFFISTCPPLYRGALLEGATGASICRMRLAKRMGSSRFASSATCSGVAAMTWHSDSGVAPWSAK